ncbi:hypothetical protein LQ938_10245 [Microbacterium sp. cx-55]|uniref:hypothetical protein n=1 Tax=Microbacterium sp. cx-55 TaxID=2875948 RepID=UPI001CBBB871|nr:hypothetical protein [Microbacterium sp. cx-55]MBZ4485859.1 hypothetical protein [Microbacterium sp. cx-55]UGB34264.1 hypothetical protein LQ938_10245 [Microbacterium sp. cx-55]
MSRAATLLTSLAGLVVAAGALSGCVTTTAPQAELPLPTPPVTPTPTYATELPEWARDATPWLIYPDGFECGGTEGRPNDFRALIGEPGPVLPEGVEYYDPAKHDCVIVVPVGVSCTG